MKDQRPLLRSEGIDELSRELLESAGDDAPSPGSKARVIADLGLGGVAAAGAVRAVRVAQAGGSAAAIWKWLALSGLAALCAAALLSARDDHGTSTPSPSAASLGSVAPPTIDSIEPPVVEPAPLAAPPVGPASPASSASAPATAASVGIASPPVAPSATDQTSSLAAEVTALDRARQMLAATDPSGALRALDDYHHSFPRGALAQEATVLRIEALVQRGDVAQARAIASSFLAANPRSSYAPRIRSLVGSVP